LKTVNDFRRKNENINHRIIVFAFTKNLDRLLKEWGKGWDEALKLPETYILTSGEKMTEKNCTLEKIIRWRRRKKSVWSCLKKGQKKTRKEECIDNYLSIIFRLILKKKILNWIENAFLLLILKNIISIVIFEKLLFWVGLIT